MPADVKICRMEYLGTEGWVHTGDIALLHPERVVDRYRAKDKFARVTVLAPNLQPTGEIYVAPDVPEDPSILVPSDTKVPRLPGEACPLCETEHPKPWDGTCLL